jgi:hypothetical protein
MPEKDNNYFCPSVLRVSYIVDNFPRRRRWNEKEEYSYTDI